MKIRGADFVMYQVSDMARGVAFYRDVLGMAVTGEFANGSWVELAAAPTILALFCSENSKPRPGSTAIGLAVDNVESTVSELEAKGVEVVWKTLETPVCWFALVRDPDGNDVVLHQRKDGTCG